jgi:hypothetical protein
LKKAYITRTKNAKANQKPSLWWFCRISV